MHKYRFIISFVAVSILLTPALIQAAPILITWNSPASADNVNDCAGLFGKPNDPCDVGYYLDPAAQVSPWIAKYDVVTSTWETNSGFPTVDGSEFTITGTASGTWTYVPGATDPAVRFWVAKGGNQGFTLHWMVDDSTLGTACATTYSLACLSLALPVTGGTWSTPTGQALSHMTFYDSAVYIPEPATLTLLGIAALGFARRWKR